MSLRRNVIANFAGQGWATVAGLALLPVYVAFLGIEAYGLVGVMVLLQTWLSLFDFGLTPALAREMARFTAGAHDGSAIRSLLRSVEGPVLAVAILIAGGIWIVSGRLAIGWLRADSLRAGDVAAALGLIGLVVAFRVIENLYRGCLVGLQHQVKVNVVTGLLATARVVGAAAVLVLVARSVVAFFVWQALIGAATAGVFAVSLY